MQKQEHSPKGRTPPHNIEAEQAVLGTMLLHPKGGILDEVVSKLDPENFYLSKHQKIYSAIRGLIGKGDPVDLITLTGALHAQKLIDIVGGASYLAELTSAVPNSSNILYYVNIVKDHSIRRNLINTATAITEEAYNEGREVNNIIDDAESKVFEIANRLFIAEYKQSQAVVNDVVNIIELRHQNPGKLTGVGTGFPELDEMTDGFQNSEFVIIGARPSIGKTAFALSLVRNICIRRGVVAGFFSLEMADRQLMLRLLSMETHIRGDYLRKGKLRKQDFHVLMEAAGLVYDAPLYFCDTPNMRLIDLKTQSRRMKANLNVEIIFIDYLSIITPENDNKDRHLQVAELSRNLKSLARELEIPIVALSQLSRDTEGREPHLASIRESGAIEQDADLVLFLHRDRSQDNELEFVETQLHIAKNRNGPVGRININFLPNYAEFIPIDHYTAT